MEKVVLIGYMGSGKSVIAKNIALINNYFFVDLDERIEIECGMSIENIFASKGELFFRKLEHQFFLELLNSDEKMVVSTGGGTPCYYNSHELLNNDGVTSIYLKASVDVLCSRLLNEKQKRPLLSNRSDADLKEFIAKHLFERSYYYNKAKDVINVDNKSVKEIVNEIMLLLT